jgi:nucleotide-binding universal stress UspA family protein
MFKHILVAVSSDMDRAGLSTAFKLAREHQASVTVMHVVNWMACIAGGEFLDGGMMLEYAQEQGSLVVANASQWLKDAGCDAQTYLVTKGNWDGSIGKTIADFARERRADLIVLGRRPTGWWHWTQENVSFQVQRHASVPVLIAPDGKVHRSPTSHAMAEAVGPVARNVP